MAIEWKWVNDYLALGIDWNQTSSSDGSLTIAPIIYRYDRYNTSNSGGSWSESITEPNGSTGYWSGLSFYGYVYPPESGDFVIDRFASRTYSKKKSAYNINFTLSYSSIGTWYSGSFHSLGSGSFSWQKSVPAKPSYAVTYNANGGSNAPSSQTKWYGESLNLTTGQPTRNGYSFVKWNTAADGSGTDYAAGATYNLNAALTLYAVWQKNTWVVTYLPNGGTGDSFTDTKTYGESLTLASSGFTRTNYTLLKWNTSADGGGTSYALGAEYTVDDDLTLYAIWKVNVPQAPTSLDLQRNSDTSATLSWIRPSNADATWQNVLIYRKMDGGEYSLLATLAGTATSYTDTSTTANHSYKYMVRGYNSGGGGQYSTPAETATIYNTPAAPSAVTAARVDNSGTSIVLYLTNPAITADSSNGFDVEYSADAATWTTSGMTVASSTGTPVTQINVSMPNGGQFYFRVRNKRGTLVSAWTVSNLVVTIAPPNPPTLLAPTSGGVVPWVSGATVVGFQWQHNPVDGSPQQKAKIQYSTDGGSTWTTVNVNSSSQSYQLTHSFAKNSTVSWRVCTKGADDSFGAYSATATFAVYERPSLSITAPVSPVVGVPVSYELAYTDNSGIFLNGMLSIVHNGSTEYTETLNAPENGIIEGSVFASEFLPRDGETYIFKFDVSSNTTLSASAQATILVDMEAPNLGTLQITNDPETGYVSLIFGWDVNSGGQAAVNATLYRVTDNGRIQLAYTDENNASCLDMYAPLNKDYTYIVVTQAESLEIQQMEFPNRLNTGWWFVYWNGNIARAKWNPNGSMTVSRPERTRVHYVGRKDPVSYDGTAVDEETSMEWQIVEREYAQAFLKMVREIGRGIYKSGSGEVYHADFDSASVSSTFHKNQPYGSLTLPIVRIDGEQL